MRGDRYLMGMHLASVYVMGVCLIGAHLMSAYLMAYLRVFLARRTRVARIPVSTLKVFSSF